MKIRITNDMPALNATWYHVSEEAEYDDWSFTGAVRADWDADLITVFDTVEGVTEHYKFMTKATNRHQRRRRIAAAVKCHIWDRHVSPVEIFE